MDLWAFHGIAPPDPTPPTPPELEGNPDEGGLMEGAVDSILTRRFDQTVKVRVDDHLPRSATKDSDLNWLLREIIRHHEQGTETPVLRTADGKKFGFLLDSGWHWYTHVCFHLLGEFGEVIDEDVALLYNCTPEELLDKILSFEDGWEWIAKQGL